ncbi:AP-2 complex subunit alpha-2 [Wickerhamomyces ciferrii]|uniref:AP-2 complex subunit alpha n=1 Tax=Wickerhamomyces ciferrii (strain ATCC 14091 / BCRC 22168 / CBS 111 / JCM 3599 / NBRC 0793 / NRRL Y-1031 F-60-10) TaxID=1206466 RepID=K0KHY4_WICCF|nr:AP-2 complex subunit alpha-2 [Wickerhamomyces ciferrii]CCH44810.1 AP-2 complex subunit alpha-2 [Wickerhamomyces ciferrii]
MAGNMKGLQQFIADLRTVNAKEEQDKRINSEIVNIQKQFSSGSKLTGYQRKKYVSKLIYIYLTISCNVSQLNLSFGHNQIIELLSSKLYSEKSIGYLAINLLISTNNKSDSEADFLLLVVNSLKNDLSSPDIEHNLLALQCIATLGNETWANFLSEDVFQILRSPTSTPLLKKRSSLALIKLVESSPEIFARHSPWIPRILTLCDDNDLGVVLSILPLIQFIAKYIDFEQSQRIIPTLAKKLNLLIMEPSKIQDHYFFGQIANPWLIVRLCGLLETLIPSVEYLDIDLNTLRILRSCVSKTIEFTTKKTPDLAVRNAHNSVLFAIIGLASHLDPSPEALASSIDAITKLLDSNETNTRYLALNSLISLSSSGGAYSLQTSRKHLLKIFHLLRDHDVSICRKSLDLIYTLTDSNTIEFVVGELIKTLTLSDHVLKSEIAIKVSVLSEKFAKDPLWFVKTMLELIDQVGVILDESIWERVVQIVVNNENLHKFTCLELMKYITKQNFAEPMVKISAYLLGEFGILIADEYSIHQQMEILSTIYFYVSNSTRAMLLTTFLKLQKTNLNDKIMKSKLIKFLSTEINSIDSELQQRAVEYLAMIQKLNTKNGEILFHIVFDEQPVFNSIQNPLLHRLGNIDVKKSLLVKSTDDLTKKLNTQSNDLIEVSDEGSDYEDNDTPRQITQQFNDPFGSSAPTTGTTTTSTTTTAPSSASSRAKSPPPKPAPRKSTAVVAPLTPNWDKGFYRIFEFNQGIFFENSLLKIILRINKSNLQKDLISFTLTYLNKSPRPLSSFITSLSEYKTIKPNFIVNLLELPETDIEIDEKTSSHIEVLLRSPFSIDEIPNLRIQFNSGGGFNNIKLKLPIFLNKFITPTVLPFPQFLSHWKQIDTLGNQGESIHEIYSERVNDRAWLLRFIDKLGFAHIEQNSELFIFAAGILHTSSQGTFGTLMKVKIIDDYNLEFRIRATSPNLSSYLMTSIVNFFEHS